MPHATRIKICGLRDAALAQHAVDAGADCVGVVFVPGSPRFVDDAAAASIAAAVRPAAQLAGVFKSEPADRIAALARDVPLDEVQLHGDWDIEAIVDFGPTPVVRALSFEPDGFADTLRKWSTAAREVAHLRALLIDTPDPSKLGGGTGQTFDWSALSAALDEACKDAALPPIILAGGLHAGNVADAIRTVRPWGVDVSSGVESSRGVKDAQRITEFCEAVRAA